MARLVNDRARKHRLMPVGIQVMSPKGDLLSKASVNDDMLMGSAASGKYLRILQAGLKSLDAAADERGPPSGAGRVKVLR